MSELAETEAPDVERVGPYAIFARMTPYGMVQPYLARRDGDVGLVVLRHLLPHLADNETAVARFSREASLATHLQHENLLRMLHTDDINGTLYIASEFVAGESLAKILSVLQASKRRMPVDLFGIVARFALDGLAYAHSARGPDGELGFVHRDLTPRNLRLSFLGEVKISDFGVARANVDEFRTQPGMAVGTLEYMSPEQILSSPIDARSDLYTLSATFYELLTGRPVVPQGQMMEMLSAIARAIPAPIVEQRLDVGTRLSAVVERGLAKDPGERPQTAAEYRRMLNDVLPPLGPHDGERLGEFVRSLLPREEAEMLALIRRVQEVGPGSAPTPQPLTASDAEETTDIAPPLSEAGDEPPEPSVITMPGAILGAERDLTSTRAPAAPPPPPPKGSRWVLIAVFAAAMIATLVAVAVVMQRDRDETLSEERIEVASEPATPSLRPSVTASEMPEKPVKSETRAKSPPPPEKRSPPAKRKRPVRQPAKAAPPPPPAESQPPPPPPPRRSGPGQARAARMNAMLRTLRKNPQDRSTFKKLVELLNKAAADLPPTKRTRIQSEAKTAKRSNSLTSLERAVKRYESSI